MEQSRDSKKVADEKRSVAVTVKMTPADLEGFKEAAKVLWPGAVLTQSGIILGLARLGAECTKKRKAAH